MTDLRSILVTASAVLLLLVPSRSRARAATGPDGDPSQASAPQSLSGSGQDSPSPASRVASAAAQQETPPAPEDPPVSSAAPSPATGSNAPAPGTETDQPGAAQGEPAGRDAPKARASGQPVAPPRGEASQASPALEVPHPGPPDGEALARAYRRTGAAPSIERATESLFPFGHVRPVLRCAPLRACAVELEAGELVLATSMGDSERWLLQAASSGPGGHTPILVVKPTACDLSTNIVVSTDRRIYEISLESPPCRNADSGDASYNPHLLYTGVARFYYPDDLVRRWVDQEELAREKAERQSQGRTPLAPGARLAHLNFDYSWDRSRRWPWIPAQIFDDGEHTYITLAPSAHLAEMPLLFSLGQHGELALLNYHLDGQTLVADRVLDRAALVVGNAKKKDEQRLEIANRGFGQRR
jgi:P-type conjugative transfer protein TrbG